MDFIFILKVIAIYFLLLILLKFMGKREIGQLSLFDLVIILIIADLLVNSLQQDDIVYLNSIVCVVVLGLLQKVIAIILLKIPKFRVFFDGKESLIINNGKLNIKEMKKIGYNIDDLLSQLRIAGIKSISEIKYALLETNGMISIFKYNDINDYNIEVLNNKDYNIHFEKSRLTPFPLIVSGEIKKNNLKLLQLSRKWLIEELKKQGHEDYHKIYYASFDDGKLFIVDTCDVEY